MASSDQLEKMALFFKSLADENRIRIVGLLARKPHSVEEIAANLGITSATVSHHIQRLVQADLIEGRVQQYYSVYALKTDKLRAMAQQMTADGFQAATPDLDVGAYERKVLDEYFVRGRLKEIPNQIKKREVVLRRLANEFEPDKRYSDKRVNEILKAFYADVKILRCALVDQKLLMHEKGYYRRTKSDKE